MAHATWVPVRHRVVKPAHRRGITQYHFRLKSQSGRTKTDVFNADRIHVFASCLSAFVKGKAFSTDDAPWFVDLTQNDKHVIAAWLQYFEDHDLLKSVA